MGIRLIDRIKPVTGLAPIAPSTSTPDYVSLKNFGRITIVITCDNATTVTGSAITLKQATAVAGTGEKALSFDKMWANEDTAASDTLTETAVSSDTFTTDATDNKNLLYVIEVDASSLDIENGFDCIRAGTGDTTAQDVCVMYYLHDARYNDAIADSAITD